MSCGSMKILKLKCIVSFYAVFDLSLSLKKTKSSLLHWFWSDTWSKSFSNAIFPQERWLSCWVSAWFIWQRTDESDGGHHYGWSLRITSLVLWCTGWISSESDCFHVFDWARNSGEENQDCQECWNENSSFLNDCGIRRDAWLFTRFIRIIYVAEDDVVCILFVRKRCPNHSSLHLAKLSVSHFVAKIRAYYFIIRFCLV